MKEMTVPFDWDVRVFRAKTIEKLLDNLLHRALQEKVYLQQLSEQPQEGTVPLSLLLMIAAAQPTPLFTEIAPKEQFTAQAPHSMHASRSTISALLFWSTRTSRGQTSIHLPQPVQASLSSFSEDTFRR